MDVTAGIGARPRGRRSNEIVQGYVSYQQAAPSSFTDPLYVVVPPGVTVEFATWPAQHGGTLPGKGTVVRVGYDDQGVPFVLQWDGAFSAYTPIVDPGS